MSREYDQSDLNYDDEEEEAFYHRRPPPVSPSYARFPQQPPPQQQPQRQYYQPQYAPQQYMPPPQQAPQPAPFVKPVEPEPIMRAPMEPLPRELPFAPLPEGRSSPLTLNTVIACNNDALHVSVPFSESLSLSELLSSRSKSLVNIIGENKMKSIASELEARVSDISKRTNRHAKPWIRAVYLSATSSDAPAWVFLGSKEIGDSVNGRNYCSKVQIDPVELRNEKTKVTTTMNYAHFQIPPKFQTKSISEVTCLFQGGSIRNKGLSSITPDMVRLAFIKQDEGGKITYGIYPSRHPQIWGMYLNHLRSIQMNTVDLPDPSSNGMYIESVPQVVEMFISQATDMLKADYVAFSKDIEVTFGLVNGANDNNVPRDLASNANSYSQISDEKHDISGCLHILVEVC